VGNRENITNYLSESVSQQKENSRERFLYNSIPVIIKDFPPEGVDLDSVFKQIESRLPRWFFNQVDVIYIGEFDMFIEREVEAVYEDGAIFVFNEQPTEEDFIETIGHELAHAIEETLPQGIYDDGKLEAEFLGKRKRLHGILSAEGYECSRGDFLNSDFSERFDDFLYREVGYPVLTSLTSGLFMSPYAATSLREYFANGFEWFFLKDQSLMLKKISPMLYYKLDNLSNL